MESSMKEIGKIRKDKAMENKLGLMVHIIMDNGTIIKLMEKGFFIIQMDLIMKDK
jgi:hypothetical protein